MFVPIATCSRFHDGRASSARSTSGVLTLTTISRSKSRPASKSRYLWVGRAKQLWLTTPFAMKSPVPGGDVVERHAPAERLDRDDAELSGGLQRHALDVDTCAGSRDR